MKRFKRLPKIPKLDMGRRMISLAQGSISVTTLKKARKRVRGTRVKHIDPALQKSMEEAGVTGFILNYMIHDKTAYVTTDPVFEVDTTLFTAEAERLVELGFRYIKLQVGWDSYRIVEMDFDEEAVREHIRMNPGLLLDKKLAKETKEALKVG